MQCQAIGLIRTPFKTVTEMPVQPVAARGIPGWIALNADLVEGLLDLAGFSHVIVLYWFHRQESVQLTMTPFLDDQPHGVFATRAPCRPNPIGLSVLRLTDISGTTLHVEDVDMLDGTPLLDIKPYVPAFDQPDVAVRAGWLQDAGTTFSSAQSDARFSTGHQDSD